MKNNNNNYQEIWEMIKNGSIDLEQLRELCGLSSDFIKGLIDAFKTDLETSSKDYQKVIDMLNNYQNNLYDLIKNAETLTPEQRDLLLKEFISLVDEVRRITDDHNKNKNKKWYYIVGVGLFFITGFFIGGSNFNKSARGGYQESERNYNGNLFGKRA